MCLLVLVLLTAVLGVLRLLLRATELVVVFVKPNVTLFCNIELRYNSLTVSNRRTNLEYKFGLEITTDTEFQQHSARLLTLGCS